MSGLAGARIDRQAWLPAGGTNGVDRLDRVVVGLQVEDDEVASRLGEGLHELQRPADHQVAMEWRVDCGRTASTTTGPMVRLGRSARP